MCAAEPCRCDACRQPLPNCAANPPAAISFLADEGFDPEFGARPVKRAIHRLVLNQLSRDILAGTVDRTHPITIDADGDDLVFKNAGTFDLSIKNIE